MSEENKKVFEPVRPNSYVCEGCFEWDDVNGCWANCDEYCGWEEDPEEEYDEDEDP